MEPTQNPNPAPEPVEMPQTPQPQPEASDKRQYGPIIGIVVIVALLILGGLYFWGGDVIDESAESDALVENDPLVDDYEQQNSSDDLGDIESDLEATSFDDIDSGSAEIEGELQAQ